MATLLKPDGTIIENVTPANGKDFQLQELYDLVECEMIEIVRRIGRHSSRSVIVIDEEGKLTGKPLNQNATNVAKIDHRDCIVGNALVCEDGEME